jgi:ATP-dependent 26S proteasome regulatory subunit
MLTPLALLPLLLLRFVLVYCRSFDRSIEVRRPDYQGRLEGIKVHLREKPIAADIDYSALAALTGGMSGAQLAGECAFDTIRETLLHIHGRFAGNWWFGHQVHCS